MSFLPEPDPTVLVFLVYKKFIYLWIIAALALGRTIMGAGIARYPAGVALVLSLAGLVTTFAPALGWVHSPLYSKAAQLMVGGGGMMALLVPSAAFAISAVLPGARWRWMDIVFALALLGLLGLWLWTS
ncbi:MAG: hypothetical protein N4A61_14965 [Pelagimonas sp.]|jgi:hypothetical protein|nr:hypothetical protein [Pelagimonas sp.]